MGEVQGLEGREWEPKWESEAAFPPFGMNFGVTGSRSHPQRGSTVPLR